MYRKIPTDIPPLKVLMGDINLSNKNAAKALQVTERTIQRWVKNDSEPWSARVAIFWITYWGYSVIDADTTNLIQIYKGLSSSLEDYTRKLECVIHEYEFYERLNDLG